MKKQLVVAVGVLVHKNRVLMAKRYQPDLPEAHHKWEFPGGKIEFGETPEEALHREILEETGRIIKIKEFIPYVVTATWHFHGGEMIQTFCLCYLCEVIKGEAPLVHDRGIVALEWITINDARNRDLLPGVKEILEIIKQKIKQ